MARQGKSAKEKGKRFERTIAHKLESVWPSARRCLDKWKDNRGQDLEGTWPMIIQCKHHESYLPIDTILQMDIDWVRSQLMTPVLIQKATGIEWPELVTMFWSDLKTYLTDPAGLDFCDTAQVTISWYTRKKRPPANRVLEIVPRPDTIPIMVSSPPTGPQLATLKLPDWLPLMEPYKKKGHTLEMGGVWD